MEKEKILVTGGAGFIGSILVPMLLEKGYKVRIFDNLMYDSGHVMIPYFMNPNFEFFLGDIRDTEKLKEAVQGVDSIIHLAALVGFPACKRDPRAAKEINYEATETLTKIRDPRQLIIFTSTGSTYGEMKESICTENIPLNPISIYGKTKADAEKVVLEAGNSIVYRYATGFGLSPRLRFDLLINDFTDKALHDRYIVVYEKDVRRSFIHVKDMARSIIHALENRDKMVGNVFNIGSEKMNLSKKDAVESIRGAVNPILTTTGPKNPLLVYYTEEGMKDEDKRNYVVCYEKIRKTGFDTTVSLDEGICELIKGLSVIKIKNPNSNA
jgi:nucleoside-diphosphate-sugar epimerase